MAMNRWVMVCRSCKTTEQVIVSKTRPSGTCLICGKVLAVTRLGHKPRHHRHMTT